MKRTPKIMLLRDVKPGQYFNEVKKMPGSTTQEGELRILFFRRTNRASPVILNGLQGIKVIAYGMVQGKDGRGWKHVKFHKACVVHLFASTPVQTQRKLFAKADYRSKGNG